MGRDLTDLCNIGIRSMPSVIAEAGRLLKRLLDDAKASFPPVAMCCGKRLRWLITFSVLALDAVQAARPGLQPSAALMPRQTFGPKKCQDIREAQPLGTKKWQRCYCSEPKRRYPSNGCGEVEEARDPYFGWKVPSFRLAAADMTCKCLDGKEKSRERSTVVKAAAVRFCAAVVEAAENYNHLYVVTFVQKDLAVTPQLCQEVLTGTLNDFSTSQDSKDLFREANGLSEHNETKGFGHLDPLVTGGLPSPTKYQNLLHHICRDECVEMVNEIVKNIKVMDQDVSDRAIPSEETCADRVVRKVEAEVLGCCARSCGWNNRSCTSWPFFTKNQKVEWLEECCGEYNVLQNSSREEMCNSVLSPEQIRLVSQFDSKAKGDVAGAYMGQDPPLLWAKPGLDKFEKQLKTLKSKPKENEPVSSDFFEKNPNVRKEGLRKGWFREEMDPQSSSLVQIGNSCQLQGVLNNIEHCPSQMQRDALNACVQADKWQISLKPDEDDPLECQVKMIDRKVNPPTEVATPDECLKVDFGKVGDFKRRFFLYDNSDPPKGKLILDKPILCFHEAEEHRCLDDKEDFERTNLNEFDRFEGFADYIYWIEESKVILEAGKFPEAPDVKDYVKATSDGSGTSPKAPFMSCLLPHW
eukprot:s2094_g13.t1